MIKLCKEFHQRKADSNEALNVLALSQVNILGHVRKYSAFLDFGRDKFGPGPGSGPGPDKWRQRSALQLQMVLALTLTLVLVLTLALAPSGMISKKGVPDFCPSTVRLYVSSRFLPLLTLHLLGKRQKGISSSW